MSDGELVDVTRRTRLAAERTWLAWWRSGIAAATAALAFGGLVPQLVDCATWPYIALGAGYAIASLAMFGLGAVRAQAVDRALADGAYATLPDEWVLLLSAGGAALALGTLLVVLFA